MFAADLTEERQQCNCESVGNLGKVSLTIIEKGF